MLSIVLFEINKEIWTIIGVIIGALLTGVLNYIFQKSQFKHNKEMFYLQNISKEKVKETLIELLNHKKYPERKFKTIRKRIGAFNDDELRVLLTEVGGVKVESKTNKEEYWYLKERNNERKNPTKDGYS